jgi:hypothetical protein
MKIEIIEEVAGMTKGMVKDVPNKIAQNLIDRKLAVEVKPKKATKDETKA